MRWITYFLLAIVLTALYYFLLSAFGLLFHDPGTERPSFESIVSNVNWFATYLVFFASWLVPLSLKEYYEEYLDN